MNELDHVLELWIDTPPTSLLVLTHSRMKYQICILTPYYYLNLTYPLDARVAGNRPLRNNRFLPVRSTFPRAPSYLSSWRWPVAVVCSRMPINDGGHRLEADRLWLVFRDSQEEPAKLPDGASHGSGKVRQPPCDGAFLFLGTVELHLWTSNPYLTQQLHSYTWLTSAPYPK